MSTSVHPRLIFVTGKGGVGKTSMALSLCLHLKQKGLEVKYNCFDQIPEHDICRALEIDVLELSHTKSAEAYIGKKLGSQTLARWVMKTPFFSALFSMLPGFGMMIVLGHILDHLEQNPNLHLVVDSPSSGHALTMLESTHNFKEMFGKGKLVEDIGKMHAVLNDPSRVAMTIVSLPTEMALQEGLELEKSIKELNFTNVKILLNDIYHLSQELQGCHTEFIPSFLESKIAGEKEVSEQYKESIFSRFPHISKDSQVELVQELSTQWKEHEQQGGLI